MASRPRRLFAEFLGTVLLATVVVDSGVAAQNLSPGQLGLELAENAIATALGLGAIILVLAPISTTDRSSPGHFAGEIVATAGLVLVVFLLARQGLERFAPIVVGAYIGAAYFFTSSTSFANPAITVGRIFTNSFAGIAPNCVLGFIGAQLIGGTIGHALVLLLTSKPSTATTEGPRT